MDKESHLKTRKAKKKGVHKHPHPWRAVRGQFKNKGEKL